jgi:hypothetical protein
MREALSAGRRCALEGNGELQFLHHRRTGTEPQSLHHGRSGMEPRSLGLLVMRGC